MKWVELYLGAYLLGGIPFGVLIARAKGIELMSVGSGNIGATNVNRALGPAWGVAVFVLDLLKGLTPALLARLVTDRPELCLAAGGAAVLGHCASPFLKFRGGKGVSTMLGAVLGTSPLVALSAFGLFCVLLAATRYMSLSAVIGVGSSPVFSLLIPGCASLFWWYVLITGFSVYRHRANIRRLIRHEEPKFSFSKGREASQNIGVPSNREKVGQVQPVGEEMQGNSQAEGAAMAEADH